MKIDELKIGLNKNCIICHTQLDENLYCDYCEQYFSIQDNQLIILPTFKNIEVKITLDSKEFDSFNNPEIKGLK